VKSIVGILISLTVSISAVADLQTGPPQSSTPPSHWQFAPVPPMGWNSYDAFGDSVTEQEILANARYLQQKLLKHGWRYVVVDYRWYDPTACSNDLSDRAGVPLSADRFGRLTPAANRFPSAADGKGFKPLADQLHGMGLRFGIHVMRGIPRQSVQRNTPIEGSSFTAADAADTTNVCAWSPDMFGVRASHPAGQAWYDSILRQYAAWGVDYVKVDDICGGGGPPAVESYRADEIAAVRRAIDRCGRPIVLSLSPGETPVEKATHLQRHANLWRISADFWDRWADVDHNFDLLARWQDHTGPGHWPDADMIPLGRVAKRCQDGGSEHWTHLTKDEQVTLMSLWAIAPSPLMLGMNLPENDAWTMSLLTNDEVLAVNQDVLGKGGRRIWKSGGLEIWFKQLSAGRWAFGLFNRGTEADKITLRWTDANLSGPLAVRDLWQRKDLGRFAEQFTAEVPPHGGLLIRVAHE
jgi:alpha-galactosidase